MFLLIARFVFSFVLKDKTWNSVFPSCDSPQSGFLDPGIKGTSYLKFHLQLAMNTLPLGNISTSQIETCPAENSGWTTVSSSEVA